MKFTYKLQSQPKHPNLPKFFQIWWLKKIKIEKKKEPKRKERRNEENRRMQRNGRGEKIEHRCGDRQKGKKEKNKKGEKGNNRRKKEGNSPYGTKRRNVLFPKGRIRGKRREGGEKGKGKEGGGKNQQRSEK